MVNVVVLPTPTVMALGAVVRSAVTVVPEPTVTVISILVPAESRTTALALPLLRPFKLRLVPLTAAVATPRLLLLAEYGGTPPPMV